MPSYEEALRIRDRRGIDPITIRRGFHLGDSFVKEHATKRRVAEWLYPEWIVVLGPDPPDLFATDGEYATAIEVVAQSLKRHCFDVSEQEMRFKDGEAVFIMEVEAKKGQYIYLVLTPNEMAAKLKGKHRRGNRIYSNVPKNLKGWEEHIGRKDKLKWRPDRDECREPVGR